MPNPFGSTFESFGVPRGPLVEAVHQDQFKTLSGLLDSGEGQLISLRAPRAGFGKTMLLSRLRQARQAQALFVPVHLSDGRWVEGEFILEEILTQMSEVLPAGGGLTRLDLHTRKLFAQGLMPMVYSGEVPCQDREGAIGSLRDRPTEAFDFHHEGAAIAQWSREQFGLLGPRLSSVLSKSSGASGRDIGYWIDLFFNYAIRPPSDVSRTADLMDSVFGDRSRFHSGAGFLEGLGSFLNLITLVEPVILILDEVDGLSSDSDAALRAASCLTSLWEAAPRVSVILSVNDDVWDSAFVPRLPLGLRDRLEDVVVRLDSLTEDEAKALIIIRAGDEAEKVIDRVDLDAEVLYPRGVLREAREVWDRRDEALPSASPVKEEIEKAEKPEPSAPAPVRAPAPMVQRLVAATNSRPQPTQEQPATFERVEPPTKAPPQQISPFTNAPVFEPVAPLAQPVAQAPAVQLPTASPFAINSNQNSGMTASALPPASPVREAPAAAQSSAEAQPFAVAQPSTEAQPFAAAPASPFSVSSPDASPAAPEQAVFDDPATRLADNADAIDDLLRQFRDRKDG
ncbi:hypothetical protein N9268_01765 [Akkermansiaceae bacterium]|nr:hypothetical protein [Akkermansiaceae bacterium]MDB4546041.1 hypothetical protein [Akkermansiaceae bacterium]